MDEINEKMSQFLAPILISFGIVLFAVPLAMELERIAMQNAHICVSVILAIIGCIALIFGIYVGIKSINKSKK